MWRRRRRRRRGRRVRTGATLEKGEEGLQVDGPFFFLFIFFFEADEERIQPCCSS